MSLISVASPAPKRTPLQPPHGQAGQRLVDDEDPQPPPSPAGQTDATAPPFNSGIHN
ncbi:hypothetical protein SAMD00023353_5500350 [Rosellinia necatrix]|uniref:Uncharacterized protein n=1 Tax=Rosellinia necatrix TaxID=77044 RepID=A0A1S8AAD5_ROSNE|nr:hypothetical protein SAMD00023353_5500350 [Rosellinia necatrix]